MKKTYVVTFALLGATLLTLLIFAGATDGTTRFLGWLETLSKSEKVILRTVILFAPLIVIFAGSAAQRIRKSDQIGRK
jgi:hypothetical protein